MLSHSTDSRSGNRALWAPGSRPALRFARLGLAGVLLSWALALGAPSLPAAAATLPPGFSESLVAGGLSGPTAMAFAPDGRLFVAEQGGSLRVVRNGALLTAAFVTLSVNSSGERGLLGVAFDPDFASNQFVYLYYTTSTAPIHNRVSRFVAAGDVAVPGSEQVLVDLEGLSADIHNGGAMHFGLDGKLYIGVGENGTASNAQTLANRLGKMLRINPDGSIPTDNPFFDTATGVNRAIWALGLRNPFSFAVQPGTGRIFINDVGQIAFEEINDGVAGSNYGWPATEGPTTNPSFRSPLFAYPHSGGPITGCAITGGAFYDPPTIRFPADHVGKYLFADFCGGFIRRYDPASGAVTDFASGIAFPVDLQVGADGNLYYLARGGGGQVFRVTYAPTLTGPFFTGGVFVAAADLDGDGAAEIVTGTGPGTGSHVRALGLDGSLSATSFLAYTPGFTGGVRVAACDFDADGRAEIVTGAGPGGGPHVRVIKLDPAGLPLGNLASFLAYPGFTGGVFVACGDVDGDGVPEIVTGADAGGGPHVRVLKWQPGVAGGVAPFADFFAFAPGFLGGVRVAVANLDASDLRASIIVGAGPGGGPHVKVFKLTPGLEERASFFAYHPAFTGGVFVAGGRVTGGPAAEIVTGAGQGGGPHVRVFTGAGADTGIGFFAYAPAFTGGVRVAAGALTGGGAVALVTGPGPSGGPNVRTFTGAGGPLTSFFAY